MNKRTNKSIRNLSKQKKFTVKRIMYVWAITIIIVIFTVAIYNTAYEWHGSPPEKNTAEITQEIKPSQDTLDSFNDYLFDKNYILHFPTGETLSFEKGVDGVNNSQEGKFSPDGKYLAYTYGNIHALDSRGNDLIIYNIEKKQSTKIQGSFRLIKDINWFNYRGKLYLLYNVYGEYSKSYFYILNVENAKGVIGRMDWAFVDFLPEKDGIIYNIVTSDRKVVDQGVVKFDDLILFDALLLSSKQAEKIIADRANKVILALKNKDVDKLSQFIHPDKGVRFSPYSYVRVEADLVFSSQQIKDVFTDETKYTWGIADGTGYPIELTFEEYFRQRVYAKDFANAKEIGYNRIIGRGNTINNNFEVYPGAIVVEYHFPGFDPKFQGMDWVSLRLVFEKKESIWYLVGIITDHWTI